MMDETLKLELYFSNLLNGIPINEYNDLRNRPDVLEKIKEFYNLCFGKLANGLNELAFRETGKRTNVFSEPIRFAGANFHFNKLGKLAQHAKTFKELYTKIGGYLDLSYFSEFEKLPLEMELKTPDEDNAYDRIYVFLFPEAVVTSEDLESGELMTNRCVDTLLNYMGRAFKTSGVNTRDTDLAEHYVDFLNTINILYGGRDQDRLISYAYCIPTLNQDSVIPAQTLPDLEDGSSMHNIARLILMVAGLTTVETTVFPTKDKKLIIKDILSQTDCENVPIVTFFSFVRLGPLEDNYLSRNNDVDYSYAYSVEIESTLQKIGFRYKTEGSRLIYHYLKVVAKFDSRLKKTYLDKVPRFYYVGRCL